MLSEPGCQIRVAVLQIFIKNDNKRTDMAREFTVLPDIKLPLRPVPNCLSEIDAVEHRRREWLYARTLLGNLRLCVLFQESSVVFDHQIFRRVGTNRCSIGLARPFTLELLPFTRFQACRFQHLFHSRKTPPYA